MQSNPFQRWLQTSQVVCRLEDVESVAGVHHGLFQTKGVQENAGCDHMMLQPMFLNFSTGKFGYPWEGTLAVVPQELPHIPYTTII